MGKKGTKRKTRWRALPLGEDDAGSGNEEEYLDEDQSTTSSVVSHATNFRIHPPVFRMGEKPYRAQRRFPYDRYRGKEPLVKLESKTFDEEEYTKITTPRQDVLFKKGYFGRKRESSAEEIAPSVEEVEGEEPVMDQYIITNGFLDERGHYYVNGSSYEVYDPYSNTVTVVVGPPPYTNGVNQPVLAAVSCQPIPLTPVEWYPPSSEWPSHGSAWTPSYPHGEQNGDVSSTFNGHDGQIPSLYQRPAYVVPNYVYSENPNFNGDGTSFQNNPASGAEASCSNDGKLNEGTQSETLKSKELNKEEEEERQEENEKIEEEERQEENEKIEEEKEERQQENVRVEESSATEQDASQSVIPDPHDAICNNVDHTASPPSNQEPAVEEQERIEVNATEKSESPKPLEKRIVEKQSHSTQTNSLEPENLPPPIQVKVKQSHSTQTVPEEVFGKFKKTKNEGETVLLPWNPKNDQGPKPTTKNREPLKIPPRHMQDERKFYQRRTEEKNSKPEVRPVENSEVESKISYAKKLLNGLENKEGKKTASSLNGVKMPSDSTNAQTNIVAQSESHSPSPANKTNFSGKRLNNDNKFIPAENKRNNTRIANGTVRTANERQRQNKNNVKIVNKVNDQFSRYKEKRAVVKVYEKTSEPVVEEIPRNVANETIGNESRSQSEKSSSVSELSSPTDLSSGQNTPPEKLIVRKMEQKIANDLNRSFQEKLKQNLEKNEGGDEQVEVEQEPAVEDGVMETTDEVEEEEQTTKRRQRDRKRNKGKKIVELVPNEKPKPNRSKKKKKVIEEKAESEESPDENLFFHLYGKSQDFLNKTWESMNKEKVEPIPDLGSILATENDEILETLGIVEKWNVPKLPLASDLLLFPGFGRERPKQKFEDFFTSAALKQLQDDMFTKTNITNMRSTKPEEFFASVVENPKKEVKKNEKKENSKNGKKGTKAAEAAVLVKKSLPKVNNKVSKEDFKCKEAKTDTDCHDKKNGLAHEEAKLGIVEAVNNWLQEQDDAEKFFSVENIQEVRSDRGEEVEKEVEVQEEGGGGKDEESVQKNVLSNPIHASLAEDQFNCQGELEEESACIRVANMSRDDGYLATETADKKERKFTRLYRSSSWDAKLSEVQIKKHFKFLTEASSWDRRKLKDATLRKHFKFIADSARVCHDLIGDVRNGYEFAREELCDPKQSVSKYYTLSPSILDSFDKSFDCENEVFDALEYKFLSKDSGRSVDLGGNLPVTDSGVHSDTESNEEATTHATSIVKYSLPNKEVCCKMQ